MANRRIDGKPAHRYTREEINFLQGNYKTKSLSEMASELGLSKRQISAKLHYLGLSQSITRDRRKEIRETDKFIADNFYKMSAKEIAKKVGLTDSSVYRRYRNILLRDRNIFVAPTILNLYTDEDREIIRKYYPMEGGKCNRRMKNEHSVESVRATACKMRVAYVGPHPSMKGKPHPKKSKYDTLEHREFMKNNPDQPAKYFASEFGCSLSTIRVMKRKIREEQKNEKR